MTEKGDLVKQKIDELGEAMKAFFGDNSGALVGLLAPLKMAVDQYEQALLDKEKNDNT